MNAITELPACGSPFEALDLLLLCQPQPTYTLRREELALLIEQYRDAPDDDDTEAGGVFDLIQHLTRQRAFSRHTFGPGRRTAEVLDHIARECLEVRACPSDIREWADLILLALDGAWRAGHEPVAIAEAIAAKQARNETRTWPDWREVPPGRAIEHRARRLLYVSGPMSGLPAYNFPAFRAATTALRARGFKVACPTEINPDQTDWHACLRRDLAALTLCDAIVLLPGWERSDGAMLELQVAHRLNLEVLHLQPLLEAEVTP